MTTKLGVEAILDCWAGSRDITIDSIAVHTPYGVKSHRMASLKAISVLTAQKARTAAPLNNILTFITSGVKRS